MRNQIISNLFTGKNFNDCINKMEPRHLREDLKQEVILIICELPEEKLFQLHNDKALEFFTVRVLLNQIKSKTSPFAKKYRGFKDEFTEHHDIEDDFSEMAREEREGREMIEDMAIEEVDKLYWYNKLLVNLYMKHGNYRAIEQETRIPFTSCYKTIRRSLDEIRETVKQTT